MTIETIEKFKGLYTAADSYSTPGSPSMNDWDVDINDNLIKTKGYTKVTASSVTFSGIVSSGTHTKLLISDTSMFVLSGTVVIYGMPSDGLNAILAGKAWNIAGINANVSITLDGADTSLIANIPSITNITYAGESDRAITFTGNFGGYGAYFKYSGSSIANGATLTLVTNVAGYNGTHAGSVYRDIGGDAEYFNPSVAYISNATGYMNKTLSPLRITSIGHTLSNGTAIGITGTTSYNGTYTVFNVTPTTFDISATFVDGDLLNTDIYAYYTGSIDLSMQNLKGFAASGGITL